MIHTFLLHYSHLFASHSSLIMASLLAFNKCTTLCKYKQSRGDLELSNTGLTSPPRAYSRKGGRIQKIAFWLFEKNPHENVNVDIRTKLTKVERHNSQESRDGISSTTSTSGDYKGSPENMDFIVASLFFWRTLSTSSAPPVILSLLPLTNPASSASNSSDFPRLLLLPLFLVHLDGFQTALGVHS